MRVAVDIGPLHGHRTGIGTAVHHLVDELGDESDLEIVPYLLSFRAPEVSGQVRLPLPARLATRMWARLDRPGVDRWIGAADVIHGTNYVLPPSRRPGVVSVYDCWFLQHPELAIPDVARAGRILRRAARRGAWIHTSSEASAAQARRLLDTDRVRSVHLGPPDHRPAPTTAPDAVRALEGRRLVVAIGTCETRKRHAWLAEVFATLDTDAHLVIAGAPGDASRGLLQVLGTLGQPVTDRIHLLGPVEPDTKAWLLHNATVMAYPSMDEGFGFPLLEAQAAGLPIVASRAGSIPEVGGDGVHLVGVDDRVGFADALGTVIEDQDRRRQLVEAGRSNLTRFDWGTTARAMVDLYRTAAGTP
jgi:glycosyltransferase involved in cell wall biosynthesis